MSELSSIERVVRASATSTPWPLTVLAHVRRVLIHSFSHSLINGNTGLLPPCIKPEILSSSHLLPKCECREQGAKAVQSECGQARQCYGIGQHRASPTLFYEDGANHKEGVRHLFISRGCPT